MSARVLVTGHFCWPWPGAVGGMCDMGDRQWRDKGGTCGKVKPCDHATRYRRLCGPTLSSGGKEQSGQARWMVQKPHLFTTIVTRV